LITAFRFTILSSPIAFGGVDLFPQNPIPMPVIEDALGAMSFCDEKRHKIALAAIHRLYEKYDYVGCGLYRAVFKMNGNHVLKFPLSESGEFCNDGEGSHIAPWLARGRWIQIDGLVCVVQEWVDDADLGTIKSRLGHVPDWVGGIDCAQVGFTRDGILKAYDFVHP
jgi:hypothetical protein